MSCRTWYHPVPHTAVAVHPLVFFTRHVSHFVLTVLRPCCNTPKLQTINLPDVPALSASFGVAEYLPGDTSETILHRADQAMYLAKTTGRNRIVIDREPVET
ncbi:MAG: diguanylate cyclase, partial [Roseiflexus sp.]|nr:diguanylate cyclase [Roseiflexus sp.]